MTPQAPRKRSREEDAAADHDDEGAMEITSDEETSTPRNVPAQPLRTKRPREAVKLPEDFPDCATVNGACDIGLLAQMRSEEPMGLKQKKNNRRVIMRK